MQVKTAIDEYRYNILHLSETTQVWYMVRLERFAEWCAGQGIQMEDVKPSVIARYLHALATNISQATKQKLSSFTVHGHARTIRTFLYWSAKEPQNYLSINVPANIAMPRTTKKIIETFSPIQIKALFASAGQECSPVLVARDKAILALLLDTGIRVSELCDLTLEHIHITAREGHIRVTGKGDKEREIGLGLKTRSYVQAYIKRYRKAPDDEPHVFLSRKNTPLTLNGLDQMIYRLAERAKITGVRASAHTFRHTFACNFLLQGGDVYVLSRLMGHSSVQVTEIYARAVKAEQARKISKSVFDNL